MEKPPYIELKNITKSFGSVIANNKINLQVRRGEIHALLGENGSGKSTLMNILSGIYTPDGGAIYIGGNKMKFRSPKDAITAKIGMIHQHFKLVEVISAKENIVAGTGSGLFVKSRKLREEIVNLGSKYGFTVNPDKMVYNMSISEKQTVEILKALYRGAEVLILDEPTAVLTPQETKSLFMILKNMKESGCAIIIITHKLNEVMEVSDRVTVLNKGQSVLTVDTSDIDEKKLTEKMVGKTISLELERPIINDENKHVLLDIKNLTVVNKQGRKMLDNASLQLKSSEIHGIAGVAGSGQKELCEAVAGISLVKSGHIFFEGSEITGMSPRIMKKKKFVLGFIPEDRLGMGLVSGMDIIDNILLKFYQDMKGLFIDRKWGRKKALKIVEKYNISTPSVEQVINKLSGGNIQKVLLAREIEQEAKILITAYPVRGLDIGASHSIYDLLNEQKKNNVGILFIGEDLDVLLAVCDRISVMYDGKIMATLDAASTTKEEIGLLMMGKQKEGANV